MRTLKSEWEGFARVVLSEDATPARREEVRNAFYGGVAVMMTLLGGEGSAEDMSRVLACWSEEMLAHVKALEGSALRYAAQQARTRVTPEETAAQLTRDSQAVGEYDDPPGPRPPRVFIRGEKVLLRHGAQAAPGIVSVASKNGRSLVVTVPDAIFCGFVKAVPLTWEGQRFLTLAGHVVLVEGA